MSKKDYIALARTVHDARSAILREPAYLPLGALTLLASGLADVLQADNPRFDRARFLEACETGACKGMRKAG